MKRFYFAAIERSKSPARIRIGTIRAPLGDLHLLSTHDGASGPNVPATAQVLASLGGKSAMLAVIDFCSRCSLTWRSR